MLFQNTCESHGKRRKYSKITLFSRFSYFLPDQAHQRVQSSLVIQNAVLARKISGMSVWVTIRVLHIVVSAWNMVPGSTRLPIVAVVITVALARVGAKEVLGHAGLFHVATSLGCSFHLWIRGEYSHGWNTCWTDTYAGMLLGLEVVKVRLTDAHHVADLNGAKPKPKPDFHINYQVIVFEIQQ